MPAWSPQDEFILRQLYPDTGNAELGELLDREPRVIGQKARALGLEKSAKFMKTAGRFQPGQQPANKGRPQAEWMPAASRKRCRRTQFKKGELSGRARALLKPLGATRIVYGNLERKVTTGGPYPAARWKPVHRLVWEAANGPVPRGSIAVFKPGMHTAVEAEITLDRIEVVTYAENMRRNSYHTRYPPEVRQVIQLRGALNRKINSRSRKREEQDERRARPPRHAARGTERRQPQRRGHAPAHRSRKGK